MSNLQGFCLGATDNVWMNLIQRLADEDRVRFSYIAGNEQVVSHYCAQGVLTDEIVSLYRGQFSNKSQLRTFEVDDSVLKEYQAAELTCMEIADRMDQGYSFSRPERERMFITFLDYWLNLLNGLKPDFIIFTTTPHSVAEYSLYAIAKKRQIPVLMFMQITAIQRVIALSDYQQMDATFINTYQKLVKENHARVELPDDIEEYLNKFESDYESAMPVYLKKRLLAENMNKKQTINTIQERINRIINLIRPTRKSAPKNYLKMPFESFESARGLDANQWRSYKAWAKQYKEKLLAEYDSISENADFDLSYVYAPLHYQPERTTCPEAERYSNQVLMLKVLAQSLPDNWLIYIKENPTQLLPNTAHGERGRYAYFYKDLLKIEKIRIISMREDPFMLIDNSQMVATLTGTTGWESILRGKFVLCFGNAWYENCEGVFSVRNVQQCKDAIDKAMSIDSIDKERIRKYLAAIEHYSFKGFLRVKRYDDQAAGEINNIENMFHMISEFTQSGMNKTHEM